MVTDKFVENKTSEAWMWFSRLNLISLLALGYFSHQWMNESSYWENISFFTRTTILLALLAIFFVIHHVFLLPLTISIAIFLQGLLRIPEFTNHNLMSIATVELLVGLVVTPLNYFYLKNLPSEPHQSEKEPSESESNDETKPKDDDLLLNIASGGTLIELTLLSFLGTIIGIFLPFIFPLPPLEGIFSRGIFVIGIYMVIVISLILLIGVPITIACRYAPESIIRKLFLRELPLDLKLTFGLFLLLGTTGFIAFLTSGILIPTKDDTLLVTLGNNWILIIVLIWGGLFYLGTIISWVKGYFVSAESLIDAQTVTVFTIFPFIMGLYIILALLQ